MKEIKIYDFSEYDPDKCNNGGAYGFWTTYTKLKNGNFKVSYGTTADFTFCPCCGVFGNCSCTNNDYAEISNIEMKNIISTFEESENKWIEKRDIMNK